MPNDAVSYSEALYHFPEIWPHILMLDAGRYLLFALPAMLLLVLFPRLMSRRRIQQRRPGARDYRREIGLSLMTSVIFSLNGFFLVFALKEAGHIDLTSDAVWFVVLGQSALIIVMHDAWFYWMHRLLHLRPLFRAAHMAHHRSLTPTPWAAYAFAPLEAMLEAIFLPIYLLIFGGDSLTILVFLMHMMARNVAGHLGHEIFPRGWTRLPVLGWITTVTHHDMHHELGRWNYGLYFTWWDRWMGTEHPDYHMRFDRNAGGRDRARAVGCSSVWSG